MRLLSFLNQVEATLAMLRPEDSLGWKRRVNYQTGEAVSWNPSIGLSLRLNLSTISDDRHSLLARWIGPGGAVLQERIFFCGSDPFTWQTAAESVAEIAPESVLLEPTKPNAGAHAGYNLAHA